MKKIVQSMDRAAYRYHWFCIDKLRKQACQLLDNGSSCSDPQLVGLSSKILLHGMRASRIWKRQGSVCPALIQHELCEQVTV